MAHIVAAHSSRPLPFFCHFGKVASFLQIAAFPWKRKEKSQVGKQDVIVPPSLFLLIAYNLPHGTTVLVSPTSADLLKKPKFDVAYSSFVRGISAPLEGDRNLETACRHHYPTTDGEEGSSGRWASSKQGIALYARNRAILEVSSAAHAIDICNLFGCQ
jgi:hypothetical protein